MRRNLSSQARLPRPTIQRPIMLACSRRVAWLKQADDITQPEQRDLAATTSQARGNHYQYRSAAMGALTASTLVTGCGQPLLPLSPARRYGVVSATGRLALDAQILACAAQRGTSAYLIAA